MTKCGASRQRCRRCRRTRFVQFTSSSSSTCTTCTPKEAGSAADNGSIKIPAYVNCTPLVRDQLWTHVVIREIFDGDVTTGMRSMLGRMLDTRLNEQSALVLRVTEAALYSQLAVSRNATGKPDPRLEQCAHQAYRRTIGTLSNIVSQGNAQTMQSTAREVLYTIMVLGYPPICTQFKGSPAAHQVLHIKGQYSYLQACGKEGFDWQSRQDKFFYRQLNWPMAILQLTDFAPALVAQLPTWRPDPSVYNDFDMCRSAINLPWITPAVPGLLEQVRRAELGGVEESDAKLITLYNKLERCLANITASTERTTRLPSIDIEDEISLDHDASLFNLDIEEHQAMIKSPEVSVFYRFKPMVSPYPHDPTIHVAWLWQIIILSAMIRLGLGNREHLEGSVHKTAVHICKSIWHVSGQRGLAYAHWTGLLLRVAQSVFLETGDSSKQQWTSMCLACNRARIERLRAGCKSFCVVSILSEKLPQLCRWRRS